MRKHFIVLGLLLIMACAASCYANNGKGQDTASATKTKTGDIEGAFFYNEQGKPYSLVTLNRMPDSIVRLQLASDTMQPVYDMRYFNDQELMRTYSDSSGKYAFRNVPVGYYQVVFRIGILAGLPPEKTKLPAEPDSILKKRIKGRILMPVDSHHLPRPPRYIDTPWDMVRVAPDSVTIQDGCLIEESIDDIPPFAHFGSSKFVKRK